MNRRGFLYVSLGVLVTPLAAESQQAGKTPVIGFLVPSIGQPGWIEALGRVCATSDTSMARTSRLSTDLPRGERSAFRPFSLNLFDSKADVIVTWTTPAALAAKQATSTIPIVAYTGNPVATGLVASLARPGGNLTGIAILTEELGRKSLELLKEAVPAATRIAVLTNPANPVWPPTLRAVQEAADTLGVRALVIEVRDGSELDTAFATARREQAAGLLVMRDELFQAPTMRLAELAARYRLPALAGNPEFAEAGVLMTHGVNFPALWRSRMALYIDKILKGAKPADLPVEQPAEFTLVINLKTAKALGLTIPPSLLLRADQVIE